MSKNNLKNSFRFFSTSTEWINLKLCKKNISGLVCINLNVFLRKQQHSPKYMMQFQCWDYKLCNVRSQVKVESINIQYFRLFLYAVSTTTCIYIFKLKFEQEMRKPSPSLHKKWSFPFSVSSVNVTKSVLLCGAYYKTSQMRNIILEFIFLYSEKLQMRITFENIINRHSDTVLL